MQPLTLAIPVLNGERFLAETLASLNANGPHLRWRLQDGGSTDRTVEIARSFARPGDTVVSEPDRGQTEGLNRAFPAMGGEIIGFINSDDLLLPCTAERVLAYFHAHPEVELVYGEVEWIDEKSQVTGLHKGRLDSLDEILDLQGVWWAGRQWVQPEVFFRRTLWERVGPFDTQYCLTFDYDFWIRCFLADVRVARVPEVFARFRLHAAQKSSASERAADEMLANVRRRMKASPKIRTLKRWRINAELSYDAYQSNKMSTGPRRGFLPALSRNPQWLLAPVVRQRLGAACRRLFSP